MNVSQVNYHRNGIGGVGFHVVLFNVLEGGAERKMFGVVFPEKGEVAVFDLEKLGQGEVRFLHNSWRGDVYEPQLRKAIKAHQEKAQPMPLPPLHSRVKITCGGYKDYEATVLDIYTRNGLKVIEVKTDSGLPLIYGPLNLEVIAYPVDRAHLIARVGAEIVVSPLAVVAVIE